MSRLTLVVAATNANGIGFNSRLPWHLSKEIMYFARITSSAPKGQHNLAIMGRNTWESIPKKYRPLPKRVNMVVTRNHEYNLGTYHPFVMIKDSFQSAVRASNTTSIHRVFIIGGAHIFAEALAAPFSKTKPCVDRILLTRIISPEIACDVFLDDFRKQGGWKQAPHKILEEWAGFKIAEGEQEEKGIKYEFQMWTRDGDTTA